MSANWSFDITSAVPNAQASSAEWIAEAPSSGGVLPLANFGSVTFTNGQATISGTQKYIGELPNADVIDMVNQTGAPIATTLLDSAKQGFIVSWHR
jgi:hypothetical protein